MRSLLFNACIALSAILYGSCNLFKKSSTVVFEITNSDTCISLYDDQGRKMEISREIEIIESDFDDTISFGHGVIPPHFKGKVTYSQKGNVLIYTGGDPSIIPTETLCFQSYLNRKTKGKIKIKYYRY